MTITTDNAIATRSGAIGLDEAIVAKAYAIVPVLLNEAPATERAGRLTDTAVAALTESGMFDLTRPRVRGGYEANVRTVCDALAVLATGCPSASWVAAVSNTGVFSSSRLSAEAQEMIYAAPHSGRMCATFAPTASVTVVDGGYQVTGAWAYTSGCGHADWIFAGLRVPTSDGGFAGGQALIPMSAATIEPSWDVTGLKGTGSNTVVVKDAFVPTEYFLPIGRAAAGELVAPYEGALFHTDWVPALALVAVAPLVGMARGALDTVLAAGGERPLTYSNYVHTKDAPPTYISIGDAAAKVETARMILDADTDLVDRAALAGDRLSQREHAQIRMHVGTIARLCREAADLLLDAAGSSAFKLSNPLQRYWRDLAIASRHGFLIPTLGSEFYGRELTGAKQTADLL